MYLNKTIIVGNITRDPELKSLPSGIKVCNFSIATNRVWKDSDGKKCEAVDYHNIVVFGRQAETTHQYMKKGSQIIIEGRLQTRSWEGEDGKKNYRTEIVSEKVQFGHSPNRDNQPKKQDEDPGGLMKNEPKKEDKTIEYPDDDINPEDIPF